MKNTIVLYFAFALSISCFAQSTPKDLGKEAFAAFQSNDLDKLNSYFPSPEQMLAKTRSMGIEFTPEQEIDFKTNFPLQINRYKMQCNVMLNSKLGKSIGWDRTVFVASKTNVEQVSIEGQPDKKVDAVDVEIHFTVDEKAYYITLNQCLEIAGIWYLGGGQVLLSQE